MRADRRELGRLLEEFKRTPDEQTRVQLLEQMERLKEDINRLMARMAELSKGIRDEHLNREALQEMMDEKDLSGELEEIAKLVREGKIDEAMKKLQELSMQMDEMLEGLDAAAEESDEEADPELAQKYEEFKQNLDQAVQEQAKAAQQTQSLRDKYKDR